MIKCVFVDLSDAPKKETSRLLGRNTNLMRMIPVINWQQCPNNSPHLLLNKPCEKHEQEEKIEEKKKTHTPTSYTFKVTTITKAMKARHKHGFDI